MPKLTARSSYSAPPASSVSTSPSEPAFWSAAPESSDANPLAKAVRLTARQQEILELIEQANTPTGYPPTRAELAATLGFRSINAAEEHIQALARKGAIELTPGASRGMRLTGLFRNGTTRASEGNKNSLASVHSRLNTLQRQLALPLSSLAQMALPLTLPLVGRVAAGAPILASQHIESTYTVEASLFSKRPDYLLTVRGMSMRDIGIIDGDLLVVQQAKEAKNGQIVVARIDDEVTVKRFERRGSAIYLLPENADFKPIIVDERSGEFSLEGIAVGLIRNTPLG